MNYHDPLYGTWTLPPLIAELVKTREAARMRGISLSVMPAEIEPLGVLPSRFHHGLGVARLAAEVAAWNAEHIPASLEARLMASAFLHDCGNPAFAHLSEHFLREAHGRDGESFLGDLLDNSETERVLARYGITVPEVMGMVTGSAKPFAEVLNGSMDVDNLDNVARFQWAIEGIRSAVSYSPLQVACSFRFTGTGWTLRKECEPEVRNWQEARFEVYRTVYGERHFPAAMMLYRAVELAFTAYALPESFFFLTDVGALAFLDSLGMHGVSELIASLHRWDWYREVVRWDFPAPHARVIELAKGWQGRRELATAIVRRYSISEHEVCAYIGKGREKRRITVPFVDEKGNRSYDAGGGESMTRVRVYLHPRHDPRMVADFVREFCEI